MAKNKSRFSVASAGFDYKEPVKDIVEEKKVEKKSEVKSSAIKEEKTSPQITEKPKSPQKVGRPKGEPKTRVTVYLPTELVDQISGAMNMYKGDMAFYISNLIKKDLEVNGNLYKQISKLSEV